LTITYGTKYRIDKNLGCLEKYDFQCHNVKAIEDVRQFISKKFFIASR
jgi:hypothetical protein